MNSTGPATIAYVAARRAGEACFAARTAPTQKAANRAAARAQAHADKAAEAAASPNRRGKGAEEHAARAAFFAAGAAEAAREWTAEKAAAALAEVTPPRA